MPRSRGTFVDWSRNAELDVVKYEVYYRPDASHARELFSMQEQSGFEDTHHQGIWGVVAVTCGAERISGRRGWRFG